MDIKGKVVSILPLQTGQGRNGTWSKRDFILETPGQFPKKVCITVMGEKVLQKADGMKEGMEVTAHINLESREYNGRYYTSVNAWSISWTEETARESVNNNVVEKSDNDLPF